MLFKPQSTPYLFISLLFCIQATSLHLAYAETEFDQNIKFSTQQQQNSLMGTDDIQSLIYRARLIKRNTPFEFSLHYQASTLHSSAILNLPDDDSQLFNLTSILEQDSQSYTLHRLDRLWFGYSSDSAVLRFGRQSVTWGNGFVFNLMDIFNPFAPFSLDREYKPGSDMLYAQWLLTGGDDWQLVYVPRRDTDHMVRNEDSSFAAKYRGTIFNHDSELLISQHYNDTIVAIGLSHAFTSSLGRFDISHYETDTNRHFTSFVSNLDYSWTAFNKNIYGFIELFHNPFGMRNADDTASPELQQRLLRGELFFPFRTYLAGGMNIELHPLIQLSPSLVHNTDTGMTTLNLSLDYNWKQNLNLKLSFSSQENTPDHVALNSLPQNTIELLLAGYF